MGADQDAIEVGSRIGVDADHSVSYSRDNVDEVFAATSANMLRYRDDRAAGMPLEAARERSRYTAKQRRRSRG